MPHTAARAYEQRDSVQRRSHRPRHPPNHPRTLVSASAAASGLLTGYQGTDALASLPGTPYSVRLQLRPPPQGWVLRAGAPALSGVFLPLFFLRRRRKNGAPGGRQQACMEKNKTQRLPALKKSDQVITAVRKQQRSGERSAHRLTGLGCTCKLVWYPVQCAAAAPTPTQGVGS